MQDVPVRVCLRYQNVRGVLRPTDRCGRVLGVRIYRLRQNVRGVLRLAAHCGRVLGVQIYHPRRNVLGVLRPACRSDRVLGGRCPITLVAGQRRQQDVDRQEGRLGR